MTQDWLSIDESTAEVPDYLDISSVEVPRVDAPLKDIRFEVMKGEGRDRVWATNGRYVACRPSGFHDGTRSRHQKFLRAGHYKHVGTFDDVQLFEILPESPFYREPGDARAGTGYEVLRAAAVAAVAHDWSAYVDLLEEIATRIKSSPTGTESGEVDSGLARQRFVDTLEYLESLIAMRRGPPQATIDAGVASVRQRRGNKPSRTIALPGPRRVQ